MTAVDIVRSTANRLGVPLGNLGNVVVVPGVLGADLVDATGRHLWLVPPRLEDLSLNAAGTGEADPARSVQSSGVNFVYAPLVHFLEPFWNVLSFAYDWRKSVTETATLLKAAVTRQFGDEDFHIVAHSMGGLIARLMLDANPGIQGNGRLIMLGTPNHGSVLAIGALTSDLRAAEFFAAFHGNVSGVTALAVARTWSSVYELLPCPVRDPRSATIYSDPLPGLSKDHLARAKALHAKLDAMPGTASMVYVAGSKIPTLDGDPLPTLDGDGVVSHRLGFLDGVRTFIATGDHVSLPANLQFLASINSLLHDGSAPFLQER